MSNKIKLVTMSDHPLVPSGVGLQTRYILEGLLKTGRYSIFSLGGAIKHKSYQPQRTEEYGEDWTILPTNGYGDQNLLRRVMDIEKPDAIWFMTDPRFYMWLVDMADEIQDRGIPMLYYHVWDNYPVPDFNKPFYDSCNFIGCISKLTKNIINSSGLKENSEYIPHAVDYEIYKQFEKEKIEEMRKERLGDLSKKFVIFYNSRNARRKMTSDIIKQFSLFLKEVGEDKAFLLMHTDPKDPEGGNLEALVRMLGLNPGQIMFSNVKIPPEEMAVMYNMADITINLSNNEGFGLSSLESLACGTPVVSTRTGGLQDQNLLEDGTQLGVSIVPATTTLVGSQQVPYIMDDRCSDQDVVFALLKMYKMSKEDRYSLGTLSASHVRENFSMEQLIGKWDEAIQKYYNIFKNGNPERVSFSKI